jgi:hypothetical protein
MTLKGRSRGSISNNPEQESSPLEGL